MAKNRRQNTEVGTQNTEQPAMSTDKVKYWFDTHCTRCGSVDTVAVSTQGNIQYRKCRAAVCRNAGQDGRGFKAIGIPEK